MSDETPTVTNDTPVTYEYYPSIYTTIPTKTHTTWGELAETCQLPKVYDYIDADQAKQEKEQGDCISFAILRDGQRERRNANVEAILGIALDLERKVGDHHPSMRQIKKRLKSLGVAFIAFTTHGHTPDEPRIRVFILFSRPVTPQEYVVIVMYFTELFPGVLDPAVKSLVQLAFLPKVPDIRLEHYQCVVGDGTFFDPEPILAQRAKYPRMDDQAMDRVERQKKS